MEKPKIVSLFTGAGLMDKGFELAGYEVVKAVEIDKQAVETWKHNRPGMEDRILCEDIRNVTPEMIGVQPGELDLVIGGPPCQGFSVAGNAGLHKANTAGAWKNDPKNLLYREFLRLVQVLQPRGFVMENVKNMFTTGALKKGAPGPIMQEVLTDWIEAGYRVAAVVLDAADYRVPQHRHRVIVIGKRADIAGPIAFPVQTNGSPTSGYTPWRTVREAIGDLPEPGEEFDLPPGRYEQQVALRVGAGNRPRDFSVQMDKPAPTIGAQAGSGGFSQPVIFRRDGRTPRRLTPQECTRLQTVPDQYEFLGSKSSQYRQIGNGVPVELARRIAAAISGAGAGVEVEPCRPQATLIDQLPA